MNNPDPISLPASELALDLSARLASGAAHELGGLLFAIRLRLETIALGPLGKDRDLDAVTAGVAGIQDVIDALRLLGARSGTGRVVRSQAVDGASWWRRTARLARYLLPPTIEIEGHVAADVPLGQLPLGRLTEAALVLIADAARTGGPVVVTLSVDRGRRSVSLGVKPVADDATGALVARAKELVKSAAGRIRTHGAGSERALVLKVPLPDDSG